MKLSCLKPFLRSLGLAIASVFCFCTLAIAQPPPSLTVWLAQTPVAQPAPQSNPSAQPAPQSPSDLSATSDKTDKGEPANTKAQVTSDAKQTTQSGGPYDLKTIEESYRSLYGS